MNTNPSPAPEKPGPRVFAPALPSRFDVATRLWVPTVNMAPATKHGRLVVILPDGASRLGLAPLMDVMRDALADFKPEDSLVAVGDPSLIAGAVLIAWKRLLGTGAPLRLLKWDRHMHDYIAMELRP